MGEGVARQGLAGQELAGLPLERVELREEAWGGWNQEPPEKVTAGNSKEKPGEEMKDSRSEHLRETSH